MINILLVFTCFIIYGQSNACNICIIDSTCGDDYIHFNISIPNECQLPMQTYFSYVTDVESEKHYINKTFSCQNCNIDLTVDLIHDAWDYTLTLESPKPTISCSTHKARCGGSTSRYIWIGTAGLSGLFVLLGGVLCTIRYCRTRNQTKETQKQIQASVLNT
jgi:hypothetical protein